MKKAARANSPSKCGRGAGRGDRTANHGLPSVQGDAARLELPLDEGTTPVRTLDLVVTPEIVEGLRLVEAELLRDRQVHRRGDEGAYSVVARELDVAEPVWE
jgi:hypothetical protein